MNNEVENKLNNLPENVALNTKIWGPPTWFFLHSMVMAYPKRIDEKNSYHINRRNSMFQFLSNLGNVLPCPICGTSYNSYLKDPEMPPLWESLSSRKSLVHFMYQIHNRVNDKLGVPLCERPSLKEVVECYSNYIANKQTPTTEEERINRRMKGCQSAKKKFSCKVSVFDNTESHNVNNNNLNINEDIHYLNEKKSQFTNMNDFLRKEAFENKNDNNFLVVILSIIIIILIISVLHLYFKKK
jgi:hypothetical protein